MKPFTSPLNVVDIDLSPRVLKKKVLGHKIIIDTLEYWFGGLRGNTGGNVLDIGERNMLTEKLENYFNVKIHNTTGDLDVEFNCPDLKYDFVIYSNVIEHQFNPLFTLQNIRNVMKDDGVLLIDTPLKPHWITWPISHFHEFDQYRFNMLMKRANFIQYYSKYYWKRVSIIGLRPLLGSFHTRQIIAAFKKGGDIEHVVIHWQEFINKT